MNIVTAKIQPEWRPTNRFER